MNTHRRVQTLSIGAAGVELLRLLKKGVQGPVSAGAHVLLSSPGREFRIPGSDSIEQLFVLAAEQFQVVRLAKQPLQPSVEWFQDIAEQFVVCHPRDLVVEPAVGFTGSTGILTTRGILRLLQEPLQGQQIRIRGTLSGQPAAHRLQRFSYVEEFLHIGAGQFPDYQAAGRAFGYQPFLTKHAERFPNRKPRDIELVCQVALNQSATWRVLATINPLPDLVPDYFTQGLIA
nr:hypothetical protein [Paenarthrobacter sp. Z7-10]